MKGRLKLAVVVAALAALAVVACRSAGLVVADGYPRDTGPEAGAHDLADALADAAVDPSVDALVVVFAPPMPGRHADEDADFTAALASVQQRAAAAARGDPGHLRARRLVPVHRRALDARAAHGRARRAHVRPGASGPSLFLLSTT